MKREREREKGEREKGERETHTMRLEKVKEVVMRMERE